MQNSAEIGTSLAVQRSGTVAGLSYYRARYYDPTVGRFLNEDPNWFDGGPSVYNYVAANAVNFIDPDGLNRLSYDQIAAIVAANNRSGQSNELIICMAYKESSFDTDASLPGNQSARGLLGVTDPAARDEGVDYDNLGDPATNISTGSDYLNKRIRRRHRNVAAGLAGYGTGRRYANSLLNCEKCLREELAVLFRTISGSSYRLALVTHGHDALIQLVWKAFINEDLHFPKRAKRRVLASSSAAMACSRLTPGYCFRNSSSVSPPSK
jgi:RHS repeat-associated protein